MLKSNTRIQPLHFAFCGRKLYFPQKPADMINGSILCIWSGPLLMKVAEDIMSGLHPTVLCKSTLTTKHKQTDTARIQIEDFANDFADIRL